jgi:hypothetical protein
MDQTLGQLQEKLDNYLKQRQSVLIAQANDPHNETINKLLHTNYRRFNKNKETTRRKETKRRGRYVQVDHIWSTLI